MLNYGAKYKFIKFDNISHKQTLALIYNNISINYDKDNKMTLYFVVSTVQKRYLMLYIVTDDVSVNIKEYNNITKIYNYILSTFTINDDSIAYKQQFIDAYNTLKTNSIALYIVTRKINKTNYNNFTMRTYDKIDDSVAHIKNFSIF